MNSKFTSALSLLLLSAAFVACKKDQQSQNQQQQSYNVQLVTQKTLGSTYKDGIISMAPALDGGILLTGLTNYVGSSQTYQGDAWIVKLNSNGDTIWTRALGGANYDGAFSAVATSDGGYVVAAETHSNKSGYVGTNHGGSDWWIIKLKNNGDTAWTKLIGTTIDEYPTSIAITPDGGFAVCGYSIDLNGNQDVMVAKLNSSGNVVWQKKLGGTGDDSGNTLAVSSEGSILIAGTTESNNSGDVGASHGMDDAWVIKLNSNGDKVWTKLLGGIKDDWASSIKSTSDGGCLIAGTTSNSENGDVTGKNHGNNDVWIVKLNASGDITWNSLLGGAQYDGVADYSQIAITTDGGYIIAGYSTSSDGDVAANKGGEDLWVLKLNSSGQKLWSKTFGGSGFDEASGVIVNADGSFWVAGNTESNNNGDVGTIHGLMDGWLIKVKDN
ncbi:hypothetical protein A3860_32590 [Niastella vici]|uniref:Bulb-type lectin domain-containing protein n=1 Tax=Niastella vici TaxID=1703345 RepID=A0A1V9FQN1_9BACT|nr:hypothetical protein [Niastella vici]OQP60556.1 hypothetical protein A3860_32590 [Niastella vici]